MRNQNLILLSLSFAALLMGCNSTSPTARPEESPHITEGTFENPASSPKPQQKVAPASASLTLQQVLTLTAANNPELMVYSLETRAAAARELQAELWPNPKIGIEVENVGGSGESSGFDGAETTIELSQFIELGNRSEKRKKAASFEKDSASLNYQGMQYEILSNASKAFVLVLKSQEELLLSNELLHLAQESFDIVSKKVDSGKDPPVEKTRAFVALSNIKIQQRQAERNLNYAKKELALYWGEDNPPFKQVTGNIYHIEPLPPMEDLAAQLKRNPQYTRWEAEIKKSGAILNLEKSKAMGDIKVAAGYQDFGDTGDHAFVFGVTVPLPISNRNQGAKQAAVHNLAKSRAEQRTAWLKLQNEFHQTYQDLEDAYGQTISLEEEIIPSATEMFSAAQKAYQEGKVDYLNVLDAQRTLFDIKNQHIESLAAYHIAKTEIACCVGDMAQMIYLSESEK